MTDTATSPRYLPPAAHPSRSSATTTTPAARAPNRPGSVGQSTTPHFTSSRPLATPYRHPKSTAQVSSPSYFGFPTVNPDSPPLKKHNWSPPSSAVRSTAAVSPPSLPLDQNPDFDAFKRQSEGKAFNLGGLDQNFSSSRSLRRTSGDSNQERIGRRASSMKDLTPAEMISQALEPPSGELSRSPKRMLSPGSMVLPEENRRGSPPSFMHHDEDCRGSEGPPVGTPRFALPLDAIPTGGPISMPRADTLPASSPSDQQLMAAPQHIINLLESKLEEVLILDLRVVTQYAKSHIMGSLSLCIPTTLLKRPSFNVQKLAETFKDDRQRRKFESWRTCSHIVVYDSSSYVLKDALACLNTIKKFRGEGYEGTLYIVRGGFTDFAARFPSYVEKGVDYSQEESAAGVDSDGPDVAPVVGGCPMPSTDNPANPFFGNIRQNMDLIGGVGLMPLQHPARATESAEKEFPEWLKNVADRVDEGRKVAAKFEKIERREKKRMEDALSCKVSWGTPAQSPEVGVQIAGLEKGNKNRYNNIWPFEHSRVKLEGVPSYGCDYFNANYIKAAWSNKRYISTQAPIPATFNDFWNVVWQQDVRIIVMLTAEQEGPQVKAHNYWNHEHYGPLRLECFSEKKVSIEPSRIRRHQRRSTNHRASSSTSALFTPIEGNEENNGSDQPHVIVRRFTLSHEKFPFMPMREITQLHYSSWPDFGAPTHPAHLLGLVEQTDIVSRAASRTAASDPAPSHSRPVLVHCSAGCGRTGTFCTVDSVIDMLKRQRLARRHNPRQRTPMDIDSSRPMSRIYGNQPSSEKSTVQTSPDWESMDVEGPWVQSDERDLVEKTVEDFRLQRLSMVQSLRQFVLCYESIMEWLVDERVPEQSSQAH